MNAPSAKAESIQPGDEKRNREKKQRLVSFSRQDSNSSIDDTATRRIGRKRTAVTKMGAVMIDHISKGGDKK